MFEKFVKMKKILFLILFLFTILGYSQRLDPLRTEDYDAQEKWVDSILNTLTLDEKIGQLFMIQAYSNKGRKHEREVKEMIKKYHVGNLIFMQGEPKKQANLTNTYQELSKVPLLIGFDGEWGLDMRLKNTYKFPWNMTLGAIQNNELIEKFGEHLAQHCKRLGIHVNFAPVVDINTNPENPIIGNRSFGERKENVTQKSISLIKGMQGNGVLATAKHFPGHGDTSTDSHVELPVLNFDKERLYDIELYPYDHIFDAGVASVMTAHLSVPALESDAKLPTSLSYDVVTGLLQEEIGFQGLVFTDGLNMKGASNYATPEEINLAAILAGNDVLLIPQNIPETIALMKQSLQMGTLTEERINKSVRKILLAKYWAGLHQYKPVDTSNLSSDLKSISDRVLHHELVKNSLTVIKNKERLLPIQDLKKYKKIAYVKLGDDSSWAFVNMLRNYTQVNMISEKYLDRLVKKLKPYDLVVVGYHKSNKNPWKDYKFSNKELVWLNEIAREKKVILSVFASPYSLKDVKSFTNIESIFIAYQNSIEAQKIAAQAIFGAIETTGKLPVSINDEFKEGTGIITEDLKRLSYGIPESVGMSSKELRKIDYIARKVVKDSMAPGMQILVAKDGHVVYQKSFGYHTYDKKRRVRNSHLYDLASLTKILASLPMVMKADEEQTISLSSSIRDILPDFANSNKDTITVKEILSHYGRLRAWIPFYRLTQDTIANINLPKFYRKRWSRKFPTKVADSLYLAKDYKKIMYKYIKNLRQRETPGYKYSDLGYYLLKEGIERKYNKRLDRLVSKSFYEPLGAYRMTYLPLRKYWKSQIVPTEEDTYYRNQLVHGYVHDMGAAMLGGIGGHAGLFSNANDVAKMMQLYLQEGYYGGKQYFKASTFRKYNKRYYEDKHVRRGLGFDKPQLDPEVHSTCGCVSDRSFGHSGFTGTYTWADPDSGIVYVFLSNRVYPTMENRGLVKQGIRTKIQEIIQGAIID